MRKKSSTNDNSYTVRKILNFYNCIFLFLKQKIPDKYIQQMGLKMRRTENLAFVRLICSILLLLCCATDACPPNCTCTCMFYGHYQKHHTHLWISCSARERACLPSDKHAAELDVTLTREIDDMLANNTQLKSLVIDHSPLTRVPAGVCNLTSLEHLNVNNNRLVALPDKCLTRLSQLVKFWASNNRITYLQVFLLNFFFEQLYMCG